jgi:hypothetical protein
MRKLAVAIVSAIALSSGAMAQTSIPNVPAEAASLAWMEGARVHTNANGSKVYEAFVGPLSGVVTGTALAGAGSTSAYTEYHRIGPNAEGVYGLAVTNSTRKNEVWNFTPLKAIEPGRIIFQSADGKLTIMYYSEPGGGIGSKVDRVGAEGKPTTQEWHFKALPAPK